jgi:hypothetical protein
MNNKLKIIEVSDYILAVSDEEIKEGDWVYKIEHSHTSCFYVNSEELADDYNRNSDNYKKIIAYQPKNNAPELDLPLLPSFKKEIVGYKLKPNIDRMMVDGILKNAMPIWNDEDKSVYFIRGHVAGSLVAKMKELQVLDLWFIPIYEDEEIKSDWVKENHLEYYYKEGIMKEESRQETLSYAEAVKKEERIFNSTMIKKETLEEAAENYTEFWLQNKGLLIRDAFIEGAKWQQERMYSEEDMVAFLDWSKSTNYEKSEYELSCLLKGKAINSQVLFNLWFKQFKKK